MINKIKIFLFINEKELKKEKEEILDLINELNNRYIENGIIFEVLTTENEIKLIDIKECKKVFMIFFKVIDKKSYNYFNQVLDYFRENNHPKIYTMYKETSNPETSVSIFLDKLDKEIKHYYQTFEDIGTLKYYTLQQLNLLDQSIIFEYKEGKLLLFGKEFVEINSIPAIKNNENIKRLREELKDLYDKFSNLTDFNERIDLHKQIDDKESQIRKLEEEIFKMNQERFKSLDKGILSDRAIAAYRMLDKGDIEGAKQILNIKNIDEEVEILEKLQKQYLENSPYINSLKKSIGDYLARIKALSIDFTNKDRFKEIDILYKKAIRIEESYDLGYRANNSYASYLYDQREYQNAEKYYNKLKQKLENLHQTNPSVYSNDLAVIYNNLGSLYTTLKSYKQSEEYLLKAKEFYEQIYINNPVTNIAVIDNLAGIYINLGSLYLGLNSYKNSEEYYLKGKYIFDLLAKGNPNAYSKELTLIYNNLGILYQNIKSYKQSEEYLLKSKENCEQLINNNDTVYSDDLARAYNNLGNLYFSIESYKQSEEYYLKCKDIYEQLAKDNPSAYSKELLDVYNNLGILYQNIKSYKQSEKYLLKSKENCEQLINNNDTVYSDDLASTYNSLGILYQNIKSYKQSEEYYLKSKDIYEQLAKDNPSAYSKELALVYKSLGDIYVKDNLHTISEEYYLKSKELLEPLIQNDKFKNSIRNEIETPKLFDWVTILEELAIIYMNLGVIYTNLKVNNLSKDYFIKSCDILERMPQIYPSCVTFNLSINYMNLGTLLMNESFKESEGYLLKSKEILEKLFQISSQYYSETISKLYLALGLLYFKNNFYKNSRYYLLKSKEIVEQLSTNSSSNYISTALCNINNYLNIISSYINESYEKKLGNFNESIDNPNNSYQLTNNSILGYEIIYAPLSGKIIEENLLKNIKIDNDNKYITIFPISNELYAPVSGKVKSIDFNNSKMEIISNEGIEITLIFSFNISDCQLKVIEKEITCRQKIMELDLDNLKKVNDNLFITLVINKISKYKDVIILNSNFILEKEDLVKLEK